MFAIEKLADVPYHLSHVYGERLKKGTFSQHKDELRGPVGLFLVREDGASGSELAKEVVGSFQYWHARTGHFFDGVFLGWGYDNGPAFMADAFVQCVNDLEQMTDWTYGGGAHLLLTDFVYDPALGKGDLDFSRTIPLNISRLLDEKKLAQLSFLIEELRAPFRKHIESGEGTVWEITAYIAFLRSRRLFWNKLVEKIGLVLGLADEVAPYVVRDIRKDKTSPA